jgi:hypothetical protein
MPRELRLSRSRFIQVQIEVLEQKSQAEDARWGVERGRLKAAQDHGRKGAIDKRSRREKILKTP